MNLLWVSERVNLLESKPEVPDIEEKPFFMNVGLHRDVSTKGVIKFPNNYGSSGGSLQSSVFDPSTGIFHPPADGVYFLSTFMLRDSKVSTSFNPVKCQVALCIVAMYYFLRDLQLEFQFEWTTLWSVQPILRKILRI